MKQTLLPLLLILCSWQAKDRIDFKTKSGDSIVMTKDIIHYNDKPVSMEIEGIVYDSKYNRLIEQNRTILLFL